MLFSDGTPLVENTSCFAVSWDFAIVYNGLEAASNHARAETYRYDEVAMRFGTVDHAPRLLEQHNSQDGDRNGRHNAKHSIECLSTSERQAGLLYRLLQELQSIGPER